MDAALRLEFACSPSKMSEQEDEIQSLEAIYNEDFFAPSPSEVRKSSTPGTMS